MSEAAFSPPGPASPGERPELAVAEGVEKEYRTGAGTLGVLRGVSLTVHEAELVAVVGASGVGKSTLLHVLGALDRPTAGRVLFRGEDLFARSDAELTRFRRHEVGFVFQLYNLLADFSALENAMLPALVQRRPAAEARRLAEEALREVGLTERSSHRPGELSGGEQQRVGIARGIVTDPTLILCDEPTGDLDRKSGDEVLDLLQALNRQHKKTIIMVTHDPHAAAWASRRLYLDKGQLSTEPVV